MKCDLDSSVPDWIIDHPKTERIFDELEIDKCCQGTSLESHCQKLALNAEEVLARLLSAIQVSTHDNE